MCNCSKLTYCMGNMVYIFERLASCCALTSVVTCLIMTLLIMLALGVGLGYNYCYIHMRTEDMGDGNLLQKPVYSHPTTSTDGLFVGKSSVTPPPISSTTPPPKSSFTHPPTTSFTPRPTTSFTPPSTTSVTPPPVDTDNSTHDGWLVPINSGIDFTRLIQKIREKKQNVTIHLVV